ncbi:hypothetical protein HS121_01880 [bacterium]|nr:hypothetical protein [bacterium]
MTANNEDKPRNVIPRWRFFSNTVIRGELAGIVKPGIPDKDAHTEDSFKERRQLWERTKSYSVGADIITTAFSLGRESEVLDVINELEGKTLPEHDNLRIIMSKSKGIDEYEQRDDVNRDLTSPEQIYREISHLKSLTRKYHRHAFTWTDLSLLYTILGQVSKAEKCMQIALQIFPQNRYILRSAARLFVHIGDLKRAHSILRRSESVSHDPWILSAEIAVASAMNKTSRFSKKGQILLKQFDGNQNTSELASALGTLEYISGSSRQAIRYLKSSMRGASENSVAQAAWLNRSGGLAIGEDLDVRITDSSEASAWREYKKGDWEKGLRDSLAWYKDQPFSGRPVVLASYILSVCMEDYESGASIARNGLRSNADDFVLINNLAFCLLQGGHTTEAGELLDKTDPRNLTPPHDILWFATNGLRSFREGDLSNGRLLYRRAIELADGLSDIRKSSLASIFLALEEKRLGTQESDTVVKDAVEKGQKIGEPDINLLINRLKNMQESGKGTPPR